MMKVIEDARLQLDMQQIELARIMGVSKSTVCRWEKGERKPRYRKLRKLSVILQVPLDELLYFFDNKVV